MTMKLYIQNQLETAKAFKIDNPIGLIMRADKYNWSQEEIIREIETEKWFNRFSGTVRFVSTFAVSFVMLFAIFNYQSYSKIISSWITTKISGEGALVKQKISDTKLPYVAIHAKAGDIQGEGLDISLNVTPPDFRMELPGIFDGNIPIVETPKELLDKKAWVDFEGQIQEDLRKGVVHYPYTAYPGQLGNVFITGHSSYYPWDSGKYKSVFALLPNLELGKIFKVHYGGKEYSYRVTKKYEVKPTEVNVLKQPQDRSMLTLMTCTPIGTTLRRLIVEADLVENRSNQTSITGIAG